MAYTVAIIAPGEMGSAVAARLTDRGVRVTTSLAGRSAASAARAERARMLPVGDDSALVGEADFILSILPPGAAVALAQRLGSAIARSSHKPVYVDCNAVSPDTARAIGEVLAGTGCRYVDGGIVGPPPQSNPSATHIYVSGEAANEVTRLNDFGLFIRPLQGPIGAASAMKMSYGGITKGFTAIAVAMTLGASRAGCAACRTGGKPASSACLAHPPGASHVSQGLSLDRRDGGDRPFPWRGIAGRRYVPGHRAALRRHCRGRPRAR
jgi:putative dehydrogenase